jgi:hypothetical protein
MFQSENPKRIDLLEDIGTHGGIIIKQPNQSLRDRVVGFI